VVSSHLIAIPILRARAVSTIERHLETLMPVLSLLTLLLYLAPAAFGREFAARHRPWMQRAAIVTLTAGVVVALVASARWFMR
jgi:hypothetical protein